MRKSMFPGSVFLLILCMVGGVVSGVAPAWVCSACCSFLGCATVPTQASTVATWSLPPRSAVVRTGSTPSARAGCGRPGHRGMEGAEYEWRKSGRSTLFEHRPDDPRGV